MIKMKKAIEIMQECQEAICNPDLTYKEISKIVNAKYLSKEKNE